MLLNIVNKTSSKHIGPELLTHSITIHMQCCKSWEGIASKLACYNLYQDLNALY